MKEHDIARGGPSEFIWGLLTLVLLLTGACFTMETIDIPSSGSPGDCLTVDLEVASDLYEYPDSGFGFCGVLLPEGWEIESMTYTGDLTGILLPDSVCSAYLEDQYGSSPGYRWLGCRSEAIKLIQPCVLQVEIPIQTDLSCGEFWLAFQTGGAVPPATEMSDYSTTAPPWYGFSIEILPLVMQQVTWGSTKANLGDR